MHDHITIRRKSCLSAWDCAFPKHALRFLTLIYLHRSCGTSTAESYVCMTQKAIPAFVRHPPDQPTMNETHTRQPLSNRIQVTPNTKGAQYHIYVDMEKQWASLAQTQYVDRPKPEGSVRVVLFGDTHGLHEHTVIPKGDVLIIHGDILFQPRGGDWLTLHEGSIMMEAFNEFLAQQPHSHKVLIAGNHDHVLETLGDHAVQRMMQGATYLSNSTATVAGLRVFGYPVSVSMHTRNRAFQVDRGSADERRVLNTIWKEARDADILITHGAEPAQRAFVAMAGTESSSEEDVLKRRPSRPRLHVYGHIHGGFGIQFHKHGGCSINAASVDNDFCLVHPVVVVDMLVQ